MCPQLYFYYSFTGQEIPGVVGLIRGIQSRPVGFTGPLININVFYVSESKFARSNASPRPPYFFFFDQLASLNSRWPNNAWATYTWLQGENTLASDECWGQEKRHWSVLGCCLIDACRGLVGIFWVLSWSLPSPCNSWTGRTTLDGVECGGDDASRRKRSITWPRDSSAFVRRDH